MHPTRIRSYSWARKWVLEVLIDRLQESQENEGVKLIDHFQYAMFCLLVFMCFGEKFDESKINEIAKVHRDLLLMFRNRWKELEKLRSDRDEVVIRLIRARIGSDNSEAQLGKEKIVAYVDMLVNLQLPEEEGNGERLSHKEMATICIEFLNAGTDTTSMLIMQIRVRILQREKLRVLDSNW
ncbi:putative cytochrome P450 [Helianthus annuus]|nr:putative cytochrome P450 [Helianthus annuus]